MVESKSTEKCLEFRLILTLLLTNIYLQYVTKYVKKIMYSAALLIIYHLASAVW